VESIDEYLNMTDTDKLIFALEKAISESEFNDDLNRGGVDSQDAAIYLHSCLVTLNEHSNKYIRDARKKFVFKKQ